MAQIRTYLVICLIAVLVSVAVAKSAEKGSQECNKSDKSCEEECDKSDKSGKCKESNEASGEKNCEDELKDVKDELNDAEKVIKDLQINLKICLEISGFNATTCQRELSVCRLEHERCQNLLQGGQGALVEQIRIITIALETCGSDLTACQNQVIELEREKFSFLKLLRELYAIIMGCKQKGVGLEMVQLKTGRYFFSKTLRKTWFESQQFCNSHGLQLVAVESMTENDQIFTYLRQLNSDFTGYWTGGNDIEREGNFVWTSGDVYTSLAYSWLPGHPANNKPSEDCIMIMPSGPRVGWADKDCTTKAQFICEVPESCNNVFFPFSMN